MTLYPWEDATDFPRTYECARCTARCQSEGSDLDLAYPCDGDCGNQLCYECSRVQQRTLCDLCEAEAATDA